MSERLNWRIQLGLSEDLGGFKVGPNFVLVENLFVTQKF